MLTHSPVAPATPRDESTGDELLASVLTAGESRAQALTALASLGDRNRDLRRALNDWGQTHYGSADAFYREIADLTELSVGHVKNSMLTDKSALVVEAALSLASGRWLRVAAPEAAEALGA